MKKAPLPDRVEPMKAILTDERFDDPGWIYERKLDGVRSIAIRGPGEKVRLFSRNDLSQNARFPEIAEAVARCAQVDLVLDGEIVAFHGPQTSFAKLARRAREPVPVFYYVFDLLYVDGSDVRDEPLSKRKSLLREAVKFDDPLRSSTSRRGDGRAFLREACEKGWEGLIAKRLDSPYVSKRSRDWLKLKCVAEQELVIGGFTAPHGSRVELGALLLGYYEDGELRYAGKVGTGFDRETLRELAGLLRPLERSDPPFAGPLPREREVTWVQPKLVAEIGFSEWTGDGRLRHPRFLGLRDDKEAREVVRERPR